MPALNFPGNDGLDYPANDSTYTNNQVTWRFSQADNSWTVITTADPGVANGDTTLGDTMVKLIRTGAQNLLTPAVNFKHDLTTGTLSIKGVTTNTLFNLINSSGTTVNSFNKSGVLTGPSVIYRQSSAPTLTADHTGVLWVDTDTSELAIYNGSSWDVIGTGVTLTTAQTISGIKTFSSNVLLSSAAVIAGSGVSKSIALSPTNSSGTAAAALTLTSNTSTFATGNVVDFNAIGGNVSNVLVNMSTAQTIAGAKTFSGVSTFNNQINFNGTSNQSILCADSASSGNESNSTLLLRSNLSTTSRYIQITRGISSPADSNSTNGIILNPKNVAGFGRLYVNGNAHIDGALTVTGIISGTTTSRTVSKGVIAATLSGGGVISSPPPNIGTLTFTLTEVAPPSRNNSDFLVLNTSSTSSVAFYYRHEQARAVLADKTLSYVERYVVLAPSGSCYLLPGKDVGAAPFTGDLVSISNAVTTNTLLGFSAIGFDLSGNETCPVLVTITLA